MEQPISGCEGETYNGNFTVQLMYDNHGNGRGFGCIASRDIAKHTLIHQERLALQGQDVWTALEKHQSGEHQSPQDDDRYLATILSPPQRQQLWRLHDQRHSPARLVGIIYSNAFSNSELGGEPCLFVGATSRFNHSCRPNIGMDFSGYDIRLFTTRAVQAGEELCLSYNDVVYYHSAHVRKTYLKHKYIFDCQCVACHVMDHESDSRRRKLGRMARQLAKQGAKFLFNDIFEQKIRVVSKADDDADDQEMLTQNDEKCTSPHTQDTIKKPPQRTISLEELIEYMHLLQVEGIDHDMLQCLELGYDLAIAGNHQVIGSDTTTTSGSKADLFNPTYWADRTLALYELQKGPHHTGTKTFRMKVQSQKMFLLE